MLVAFLSLIGFAGCNDDENKLEDRVETITMYVSSMTEMHFLEGMPEPMMCMMIKAENESEYQPFVLSIISGFEYTPGYNYTLLVEKTTLANPPMDASCFTYRLIEVQEQTLDLSLIPISLFDAKQHTGNIFDPIEFSLFSFDQKVTWVCDSLVWTAANQMGSLRVYDKDAGKTILSWTHYFPVPGKIETSLTAYKDGKVVHSVTVPVTITDEKDFLAFNWADVRSGKTSMQNLGLVNALCDKLTLYFTTSTLPSVQICAWDAERSEGFNVLYQYFKTLYGEPNHSKAEGKDMAEVYESHLFQTPLDGHTTPLMIWSGANGTTNIALMQYFDEEVNEEPYYKALAEPMTTNQ